MDWSDDLAGKTADELKQLHTFFSIADEAYRTFRAMHLEDRKNHCVQRVLDWVPCSTN
jgi:hypothetical protein